MIKSILSNYNHAKNDISTLNSHASSLLQLFTPVNITKFLIGLEFNTQSWFLG
jgi:hypothetical protein